MANGQISNIPDPNVSTFVLNALVVGLVKASAVIAAGDYIAIDAGGYLVPCGDTAGIIFTGQAAQTVTGGSTDGAVSVQYTPLAILRTNAWCQMNAATPVFATWVGKLLFFTGPKTVGLVATPTNKIVAGRCQQVPNTATAGSVYVDVGDLSLRSTT